MHIALSTHDYTDVPPSSTNPGTQPPSNPARGTQPPSNPIPGSPLVDLGLVAGVAGSMVVLALVVAVGIVVLVIWWR